MHVPVGNVSGNPWPIRAKALGLTHNNARKARPMSEHMPLKRKLDQLGKAVAKRESAKVYQFPLWGEPQRGVPNDFARSALFSARKGTGTEYLRDIAVFSQAGVNITYTGPQLTQDHLDVFEGIMHLARDMPEGNAVCFTARGLLKLIGRRTSGRDHERLLRTLKDLTATAVTVTGENGDVYWSSLLPEGAAKPSDGYYRVNISRQLIKLFERGFTVIEWEQRKQLTRKPLAQAVHVWLCSHEKPYPVTVQYLHDITGSNTKALKRFRQSLKAALTQLKDIGVLADWRIDERDKVHFVKA